MQLVTVSPLTRGLPGSTLTYYTAQTLRPGTLVSVPLGRRLIDAIVTAVTPVQASRSALREAAFALKKIARVKQADFLSPAILEATRRTADYLALPQGAVIKHFLPQAIIDTTPASGTPSLIKEGAGGGQDGEGGGVTKAEKLALQDSDEDRLIYYKSLIREQFAKHHSVWLCLPSRQDLERATSELARGIEAYVIVLHPGLKPKVLVERWREAQTQTHPVVIAATPAYLMLQRPDVKTIIIDRETAEQYKTPWRPIVDSRRLAEDLAEALGAKLIFGAGLLRTETRHRTETGELFPISLKQRLGGKMPLESKLASVDKTEAVGEAVLAALAAAGEAGERSLVLAGRRGLAPIAVCRDCGQSVTCRECGAPVVLHERGDEKFNQFVCHHCGAKRSAAETCRHCDSWRLAALGIGIESVAAALASTPSLIKEGVGGGLFHLDADHTRTPTQAAGVVKKFLQTPGSLLIATEMALYYLKEPVDNVFCLGYDSILALPDFRIREKLFNSLIRARSLAKRRFIIQTRHGEETLFHQALKGQLGEFHRQETGDREAFNYPPFQLLIKVARTGVQSEVMPAMKALGERLQSYEPALYPSLQHQPGGLITLNLLLKLDPAKWPSEPLLGLLRSLPASFTVEVDPDQLL